MVAKLNVKGKHWIKCAYRKEHTPAADGLMNPANEHRCVASTQIKDWDIASTQKTLP